MTSPTEPQAISAGQLGFGIRQARRSSVGAYIASPVIAIYLALTEEPHFPLAWLGAVLIVLTARNRWLGRAALHLEQSVAAGYPRALRALAVSSMALSLTMGALPVWALPELSLNSRLFLSCVMSVWLAGGMASLGVLPRLYMAYAGVVVLGLSLGWLRTDEPMALPMTILLLAYLGILLGFSRSFARMVARGIEIRHANTRLVEELQLANEAKSRFILAASHDLRQPLHALSLFSSALNDGRNLEQMRAAAAGIRQSVDALAHLLADVLDISRMDSRAVAPKLSPVFLPALIGRLGQDYGALCRQRGLRWQSQVLPVTLNTDPVLLERLLRNLLDNAIKHGAQGPVGITMTLNDKLRLTVSDHGAGIAPADREHVFQEFYRLPGAQAVGGLGLGLSIVRRIAELLGYRLSIDYTDAQQRRGTSFHVEIGLQHVLATPDTAESPHEEESSADLAGLTVLVLDNDIEIVHATALLLRQWGCQAEGAADLADWKAQHLSTDFRPDVVLLDNDSSALGDALDMAREITRLWPEAGILLVTGESDATALARLRNSGYPLLEKPVDPRELREVLEMFRRLG